MNFSLKQALKVLVVFACAVGVVGTSVMITNKNTDNAKNKNDSLWNVVDGDSNSDDNNTSTDYKVGDIVSKTESQVGKYADIDGNGTVDGVIFADLMVGGSGTWNPNNYSWGTDTGAYSIPTISSSKDYCVSQKNYTNELGGTADVLTPTGEGNDRFYVMALKDINDHYSWYDAAYEKINDYNTVTSEEFGTGRQNTLTMIDKWNSEEYGEQNANQLYHDVFGKIQDEVNKGWFMPSRAEWAAFGSMLNVTEANCTEKGLEFNYFSSSLKDSTHVYSFCVMGLGLRYGSINNTGSTATKLATTF